MTWRPLTPAEEMAFRERQRAEAEASWRHITEAEVRTKLRALDGHPFRLACGRMLAAALRHHCPHMLGMLPPDFLSENDNAPVPMAAE